MSSYLALNLGYIDKTHTHTQSGAENSLFQVCLTITKPFSPFDLKETTNYLSLSVSRTVSHSIMRVNKPTVAYKLVQLCSIIILLYGIVLLYYYMALSQKDWKQTNSSI